MTEDTVDLGVELWVPTRGRPFMGTIAALNEIGLPYQFMPGDISIADVRNRIVRTFLDGTADVLLMVDDDVIPPPNLLDLVAATFDYAVVGGVVLTCSVGTVHLPNVYRKINETTYERHFPLGGPQSDLEVVDAVGCGCIAIRREVLTGMRAPFRFVHDQDGVIVVGEDIAFCDRARRKGFTIAAHFGVFCEHYDEVYAGGLAQSYMGLMEEVNNL